VSKQHSRTPKNYDGTQPTSRRVTDVLPQILRQIGEVYEVRPDLVLASWPEIIGPRLASMTRAISLVDGVLTVRVKNSTLHSLLSQHDKPRILKLLRARFPKVDLRTIVFRVG
jgi:hypothetical protein